MTKRAIIFGAKGQDGTLLARLLAERGYFVVGVGNGIIESTDGEPHAAVDLLEYRAVDDLIVRLAPHEIYYLAAFHHSSQSADLLSPATLSAGSFDVQVHGLTNVLEAIRQTCPSARLFYAGSSLMYGNPGQTPQTEDLPFTPMCVYSIAKTAGAHCCRLYRERQGVFASVGILYNHESHLRREEFLSRKVIRSALRIKRGDQHHLVLGDLSAQSDWGYAPDFVDAMHRILQLDNADDFIIATGQPHRVVDWVEEAFTGLGLSWRDHVREDRSLITRENVPRIGDISKLTRCTGWRPATSFQEMVRLMVRSEEGST